MAAKFLVDNPSFLIMCTKPPPFPTDQSLLVTSITPNKMADKYMSFRQCAVNQFLVKEEIPAAEIHQRLQRPLEVCAWVRAVFEDG